MKYELSDAEKKKKLILDIADFYIENNSSTRKTGKEFGISNFTIHSYLTEKLPIIDINRFLKVAEIINRNKPTTIYGDNIKNRLDDIYECIVKKNMEIKEVSKLLKISEKTIYQDIANKMDKEKFLQIKSILAHHSMMNSPMKK